MTISSFSSQYCLARLRYDPVARIFFAFITCLLQLFTTLLLFFWSTLLVLMQLSVNYFLLDLKVKVTEEVRLFKLQFSFLKKLFNAQLVFWVVVFSAKGNHSNEVSIAVIFYCRMPQSPSRPRNLLHLKT